MTASSAYLMLRQCSHMAMSGRREPCFLALRVSCFIWCGYTVLAMKGRQCTFPTRPRSTSQVQLGVLKSVSSTSVATAESSALFNHTGPWDPRTTSMVRECLKATHADSTNQRIFRWVHIRSGLSRQMKISDPVRLAAFCQCRRMQKF